MSRPQDVLPAECEGNSSGWAVCLVTASKAEALVWLMTCHTEREAQLDYTCTDSGSKLAVVQK